MLGFSTYAALLPELRDLWHLSNAQAGVVSGMFFAGYVSTVSLWTALTDRVDGRRVYVVGAVLTATGGFGFALFVDGFAGAIFFQVLLGVGIAATYMPGLRLLSDRVSGPLQSRPIAFYTSFFGIGTALSLALAGFIAPAWGWRTAFGISSIGPVAAGALVWLMVDARTPGGRKALDWRALFPLGAWKKVLANRAAAGYTAGYFAHCLELFGSRAWMVAFLGFSAGLYGAAAPWPGPAIAAVVNLVAVPASILGNEAALRIGRKTWVLLVMGCSGSAGIAVALCAGFHWAIVVALLVVYAILVMGESATLTAGLIAAAPADLRGAAMGLYSLLGFGGGLLGPVVFGAALDATGRGETRLSWIAAYAAIGAGCLAAPLVARFFGRS